MIKRETERQRHRERQTDRETNRQTGRQRDRERERQTEKAGGCNSLNQWMGKMKTVYSQKVVWVP